MDIVPSRGVVVGIDETPPEDGGGRWVEDDMVDEQGGIKVYYSGFQQWYLGEERTEGKGGGGRRMERKEKTGGDI